MSSSQGPSEKALQRRQIQLRGVRVHNLQSIDLDIPHGQWLCLCGVSGSGKTSLAIDTLLAEGQRRYIECFNPYTRQFLQQWDKPDADQVAGIPPALAVSAARRVQSGRATVGGATEILELLRSIFTIKAEPFCESCQQSVAVASPDEIAAVVIALPDDKRLLLGWQIKEATPKSLSEKLAELKHAGFRRVLLDGEFVDITTAAERAKHESLPSEAFVIVDRMKTPVARTRVLDSVAVALGPAGGMLQLFVESNGDSEASLDAEASSVVDVIKVEGRIFEQRAFSCAAICPGCHKSFVRPEPVLFNFNSPRGACPDCQGFGDVDFPDLEKIVPDKSKSLREGAIAPWTAPAYQHEQEELLALADHHDLPVDVPFADLNEAQLDLIWKGDRKHDFGGLNGFFRWLERRRYKMHLRVFLARWKSWKPCPTCQGRRLNPDAIAWRIAGQDIADVSAMEARALRRWLDDEGGQKLDADPIVGHLTLRLRQRLDYLIAAGLAYLAPARSMRTLSSGERQRVGLARALGSSLVNLLYVLDEPSNSLHPEDVKGLIPLIERLQRSGNTVVIVDHHPTVIASAERAVELGPGAGIEGGCLTFDGSPAALARDSDTATGPFLAGERGFAVPGERRSPKRTGAVLKDATGLNLRIPRIEFPLGVLCAVSGVSGSGKTSLVTRTLFPAAQAALGVAPTDPPLAYGSLSLPKAIEHVVLIDQQPLTRTSRSNPATFVKAFDEIRKVFAAAPESKARGFKAGHFSFNVAGGRCERCQGEGHIVIDMQFMADILRRCDDCGGTRFQAEVLEVRFRNRSIADVLAMTAAEAFSFFRGERKIQARLKHLMDAGLDYLQLGRPLSTLSSGEAQRLKLATYLGNSAGKRALFVLDEPASGLHMADTMQLIQSLNALVDIGHSVIVIEHNLLVLGAADWIIDLGPGAAAEGGTVVATGTPEAVAADASSTTGRYLKSLLEGKGVTSLGGP